MVSYSMTVGTSIVNLKTGTGGVGIDGDNGKVALLIQSDPTNTGNIAIGDTNVAVSPLKGTVLTPGQSIPLIAYPHTINFIASLADQVVGINVTSLK